MNIASVTTPVAPVAASAQAAAPTADTTPRAPQVLSEESTAAVTVSYESWKTPVAVGKSAKEQAEFDYRAVVEHYIEPRQQANTALETIDIQLKKIDKAVSAENPRLSRASWDFTVEEGKLKVTGDLSVDDKKLIESKLNGNGALTSAVKSYMGAVEDYLETSEENPVYSHKNIFTGNAQMYEFHDVLKNLEGKFSFRDLISSASASFEKDAKTGQLDDQSGRRGMVSMEILASRLAS